VALPPALEQRRLDRAPRPGSRDAPGVALRFAVYCAYNPLFRREAFKKQGMRLGTR
jgi:hypothetical protein